MSHFDLRRHVVESHMCITEYKLQGGHLEKLNKDGLMPTKAKSKKEVIKKNEDEDEDFLMLKVRNCIN